MRLGHRHSQPSRLAKARLKSTQLAVLGVLVLAGPPTAHAIEYSDPAHTINLSGAWLFHAGDNLSFERPSLDDLTWTERRVPTTSMAWHERWHGYGWYRLHLSTKANVVDKNLMLSLGSAREAVEVYVNGSLVARRGSFGGTPRSGARLLPLTAMVPAGLLHDGDNVIAVRMYDPSLQGGLVSGPLLLGPPTAVEARVSGTKDAEVTIRVALGLLALFLGLAQLVTSLRMRGSREGWWLLGTGIAIAGIHLSGLGLFDQAIPNATLSERVPLVLSPLAILCFGSYYAARYQDFNARRIRTARIVLVVLAVLILLLPDNAVFFGAEPALLPAALVITLYAAHLCAQAARRRDSGAVWNFVVLSALAMLIVYDGLTGSNPHTAFEPELFRGDALPPTAVMGAVGVLLVSVVVAARDALREHESVLLRMLKLERRVEGHELNVLDAITLSMLDPERYINSVVHEIAAQLDVRRCSMMLVQPDGSLRIRASVGLPKHASHSAVDLDKSIAGWVFLNGQPLTSTTLPDGVNARRTINYITQAFLSYPLLSGSRTIGVLNVSDRNNGGDFVGADEILVTEIVQKLSIMLGRIPHEAWVPPASAPPRRIIMHGPAPKAHEHAEEIGADDLEPDTGGSDETVLNVGALEPPAPPPPTPIDLPSLAGEGASLEPDEFSATFLGEGAGSDADEEPEKSS